jgi:hypothetical protein
VREACRARKLFYTVRFNGTSGTARAYRRSTFLTVALQNARHLVKHSYLTYAMKYWSWLPLRTSFADFLGTKRVMGVF